jgi:hypothetical protein
VNDTKKCAGCRNDYYNRPGNSATGKCWSLGSAKMVDRYRIHINQQPPYTKDQIVTVPDCYKEQNYVHVSKESISANGNWA